MEIDRLLEDILVDAYGEDEQLWAFLQAFEDEVPLPTEGSIIGETVLVNKIDYDGNTQCGLRATCQTIGLDRSGRQKAGFCPLPVAGQGQGTGVAISRCVGCRAR